MKRMVVIAACGVFVLGGIVFAYGAQMAQGAAGVDLTGLIVLPAAAPCDAKVSAETTATVVAAKAAPKTETPIATVSSGSSSSSGSSASSGTFGSGTCSLTRSGDTFVVTYKILDSSGRPMSGARIQVSMDYTPMTPSAVSPGDYSVMITTNSSGLASTTVKSASSGTKLLVWGLLKSPSPVKHLPEASATF